MEASVYKPLDYPGFVVRISVKPPNPNLTRAVGRNFNNAVRVHYYALVSGLWFYVLEELQPLGVDFESAIKSTSLLYGFNWPLSPGGFRDCFWHLLKMNLFPAYGTAAIYADVRSGLLELKQCEIIFTDLVPGNILIDPNTGRYKIIDYFG